MSRSACLRASSRLSTGPLLQGAIGTPTCSASCFAPILSPSRRIASAEGPTKVTPRPLAQLGEGRVLGDEAPPDPGGVGPGLAQRALQHRMVEVGPVGGPGRGRRRRPPRARTSRAAHPRCAGRWSPWRGGLTPVEFPDGVDQPHGCLAPVHDRDPPLVTHRPPPPVVPAPVPVGSARRPAPVRGPESLGPAHSPAGSP